MSSNGWENFRDYVLADSELQSEFRSVGDKIKFIQLVTATAESKGFDVTADNVEESLKQGRRTWIERWI